MANAWRENFDRMPPLAWQRRFLAATLGCTIDASTPAPDLLKAAREALCRERQRTLPFRKAANAIASNSTKKDLDVHRPVGATLSRKPPSLARLLTKGCSHTFTRLSRSIIA